MIGLAESWLG